jgi:hypothetical protein
MHRSFVFRAAVASVGVAGFTGCLDAPLEPGPAAARLVAGWDPLGCGEPHRVAIELEDDRGDRLSASTPCNLGALTVDVDQFGTYRGRIYAWVLGAPIRSITLLDLTIDQPIVRWFGATPQ